MPDSFSLDYETYSEAPLGGKKGVGAHKYAEHPSTEILLAAVSKNGAEPLLWDRYYHDLEAEELVTEMASGAENIIWAWNANFEAAISKYLFLSTFGVNAPLLHQWRCPASVARRMAIPFSLGDAAAFLGLGEQKDKRGSALIKIFSIPQTTGKRKGERIHPIKDAEMIVTVAGVKMPVHEAWQLFRAYCIQDVKTEQAAALRLKSAEFKGDILDGFQFDMIMNDRGIPVDVEALHMAKKIVDDYSGTLITEFQTITGGMVPTQVAALLPWLQERGYKGDNLRAATMDEALDDEEEDTEENSNAMWRDDATPEAKRALAIRQAISFAAVKKIPKMIDAACSDGRVRGALMFWGAQRTGRSSGRIIQPQNFRRPTIESHVQAFWDIRNGMEWSEIEMLHGPVLEVLASTMRHFIREPERQFLDTDFSQIEARMLAWVAGHKTLLDAFRKGEDLYKITASTIYGVPYGQITKDQRFIGKVAALACIAEGQTVLTDHGILPIEEVTTCHRVWDGVEWVQHEGVVYKGIRKVETYQGLTATEDHIVFLEDGSTTQFGKAKAISAPLKRVGASGAQMGKLDSYLTRENAIQRKPECSGKVRMRENQMGKPLELEEEFDIRVQFMRSKTSNARHKMADEKDAGGKGQVLQSEQSRVEKIRWAWDTIQIRVSGSRRHLDREEHGNPQGFADRSEKQRRALRRRKFEVGHLASKQLQPNQNQSAGGLRIRSGAVALQLFQNHKLHAAGTFKGANSGESAICCGGEEEKLEKNSSVVRAENRRDSICLEAGYDGRSPITGAMALLDDDTGIDVQSGYGPGSHHQTRDGMRNSEIGKHSRTEGVARYERVYDIMNAGPRNRFTVSGVLVHNCGYQGGESAFASMTKLFGVEVDPKKAREIVKLYRDNNPEMPRLWRAAQKAAVDAINNPGEVFKFSSVEISFQVRNFGGYPNLFLKLPSGRQLVYPKPMVRRETRVFVDKDTGEKRNWEVNVITYWGQRSAIWCRVETHGGTIVENICQSLAGEFLTLGVVRAERAGYETFMVVHDQALSRYEPEKGQSTEEFTRLMCELPPWAPDFPLEAKTDIVDFYTKD